MKTEELKRLAKLGLEREIQRLNDLLHVLEGGKPARVSPVLEEGAGKRVGSGKGTRRPMSPAAKKALSLRMKARWAALRSQNKRG